MNKNDRLLEMGCGAGLLSTFLKKYRYFGVDKSCSLVNKHINLFNNIVLNFSSVDVIFKDNYFDYAIVNSMFEYLKDYEEVKKTVDELERVSKKGVFSTINEFKESDIESMPGNTKARNEEGFTVKVPTISLNDVFIKHFNGDKIDYMSVDT